MLDPEAIGRPLVVVAFATLAGLLLVGCGSESSGDSRANETISKVLAPPTDETSSTAPATNASPTTAERSSAPATTEVPSAPAAVTGGVCDLLTPDLAAEALGGQVEVNGTSSGVEEDLGADLCTYNLVGGATSTFAQLIIFEAGSPMSGGLDTVESNCAQQERELTHVDEIFSGALRCLLVSSYDGSVLTDSVSWDDNGRLYSVELNADGDDQVPVDVVLSVASQIAR